MSIELIPAVDLASYTTLGVGGKADYFVRIERVKEVPWLCEKIISMSCPLTILGGGSNVLVSDSGVRGVVALMAMVGIDTKEEGDDVLVRVGAGVVFDDLVEYCARQGWWGLENLSHIPGTVGATPIQNVGAYGVEVSEVIDTVQVFDRQKERFIDMLASDCGFQYRDSLFKSAKGRFIVVSVTFRLSKKPMPKLHYADLNQYFISKKNIDVCDVRKAVVEIRSNKFPKWQDGLVGTAGSFFKNPIVDETTLARLKAKCPDLPVYEVGNGKVKLSLGWILDKLLNRKGYKKGAVGHYEKQALVLVVDHKKSSAEEIDLFAKEVEDLVNSELGIKIEREVTMVGV